ncbi:MAG: nucleotidyltransferase domain-containing protein [Methanobacteriaceae archaeon]|jgi:predicted nucleotidyltransferase|nr:nucleotidyltransferase domain-containing protein [Methanobacteriaceae archaeon]
MSVQDKYRSLAHEFAEKVLEKYGERIDTIILFGSTARGEAREESDIDILVVGEINSKDLVDISYPMLLEYGEYISPKDMKKAYFNKLNSEKYSFIQNILSEGQVLYERVAKASGESPKRVNEN